MAIAAEAPQIPTAPPVNRPRSLPQPSKRDHNTPKATVIATAAQTAITAGQPNRATSPILNLSPSNATQTADMARRPTSPRKIDRTH